MGFQCGIVGLPNVGKSTIFNALTAMKVPAESFPFCTIEPNLGRVPVPDRRLRRLAELVAPEKITPTTMDFVDVAGLVKGAHLGEGLGNQFLGHLRNMDALAHIVRCFEDPDVAHIDTAIRPAADAEIVNLELILADLQTVQKRLEKLTKLAKVGQKDAGREAASLDVIRAGLESGKAARLLPDWNELKDASTELNLLTAKPLLYVANVAENDTNGDGPLAREVRDMAAREQVPLVVISGKVEAELSELDDADREMFMGEMGIAESGLDKLIHAGYRLLGLITFYTTVGPELRAWTVAAGSRAPKAAGRIHTDMERGFIKAEVLPFTELDRLGSESAARQAGLLRMEGKEYVIQDGDIVRFRFNV